MMHGTFRDPRVPAAAAGRAGRTSVYGMVTCGQLDNMVRPEAMHCTIRPWQVAGAVPRTGAASVLALGVAAIDSGPATLVLGHEAGAIFIYIYIYFCPYQQCLQLRRSDQDRMLECKLLRCAKFACNCPANLSGSGECAEYHVGICCSNAKQNFLVSIHGKCCEPTQEV